MFLNKLTKYILSFTLIHTSADNNSMVFCDHCNREPCIWEEYRDDVIEFIESKKSCGEMRSNMLRKYGYQECIRIMYGRMGKGNRVELPRCVVSGVRNEYPDVDNRYMGYKDE